MSLPPSHDDLIVPPVREYIASKIALFCLIFIDRLEEQILM